MWVNRLPGTQIVHPVPVNHFALMKRPVIFLSALLLTLGLQAQPEETLFGNGGLQLTGAWGSVNPGFSNFAGEDVAMGGGFIALEFNKALLLGLGGSHSTERFSNGLKYDLNGAYLGYILNPHRAIHPKFNLMIGAGQLKPRNGDEDKVFSLMPGAGVEVNLFRWFRLSLNGNYRFVSNVSLPGLDENDLSGFLFDLQLRFGWSWGN